MQPIPLPELANSNAPLWIILVAIGAILTLVGLGASFFSAKAISRRTFAALYCSTFLGIFMLVGGGAAELIGSPSWQDRHEAQAWEIRPQIEESYGLDLSTDEIIDLKWPESTPERDFKVFGSVVNQKQVEGAQFIERTVYLVWADGQLQLSESEDGKSFTELEPTE